MSEAVLAHLDDNYTVRVLKDIISIPSVVGQEGALADYLCGELKNLGLDCECREVEPGRPNVYAKLAGVGPGKRLNFNGHTDTVPPVDGWDQDPFLPLQRDGKLFGLGACDMKAGIACILNVLRAFVNSDHQFSGELSFCGVIDEEAYSKGARAMLASEFSEVDAIILAEPYPGDEAKPIPLGMTGKILYDVHVTGKAAHGFRPHLGVNAVEEAAKIIASLDQLRFHAHPDFGQGNSCVLKIEGGYERYAVVIPSHCRFEVNRLLVPGESVTSAVEDMQRLVESLNLSARVDIRTKPPMYEPYIMSKQEQIIQVFDQVYREILSAAPLYEYAYGITDANLYTGEGGIPCLHLGPQRGGAHQSNEYVPLGWLPLVSKMYALIAVRFLGEAIA